MQAANERRGNRARISSTASSHAASALAKRDVLALSLEAVQLLGRWQRVCNSHISFTMGCACGYGGAIDLRDFDDMILDYLLTKFGDAPPVAAFIATHAGISPAHTGSLKALLRAVATTRITLELDQADGLLQAIRCSIASIEEQHAA